jgi:hypothetical protein
MPTQHYPRLSKASWEAAAAAAERALAHVSDPLQAELLRIKIRNFRALASEGDQ